MTLKMTPEQEQQLRSMQAERTRLNADLSKITGLQGNGAEGRFRAQVEAEYDFREACGERGIMR